MHSISQTARETPMACSAAWFLEGQGRVGAASPWVILLLVGQSSFDGFHFFGYFVQKLMGTVKSHRQASQAKLKSSSYLQAGLGRCCFNQLCPIFLLFFHLSSSFAAHLPSHSNFMSSALGAASFAISSQFLILSLPFCWVLVADTDQWISLMVDKIDGVCIAGVF